MKSLEIFSFAFLFFPFCLVVTFILTVSGLYCLLQDNVYIVYFSFAYEKDDDEGGT